MPNRYTQLLDWINTQTQNTSSPITNLEVVAGDASFRRYYRTPNIGGHVFIVMDAPPEHEDCTPFIAITEQWSKQGIAVPKLFAKDLQLGFLLLEDFGDIQLFEQVYQQSLDAQKYVYQSALDELQKIQALDDQASHLPSYDRPLLLRELQLFTDWLIGKALGISLTADEQNLIEQGFEVLIENALNQTKVPVHRDYHSRNLMCSDGAIGVIDFQDAVYGPATYDLVSLLRDCYIELNPALVQTLALSFKNTSPSLKHIDDNNFCKQFDLMGIQRHMKAAGIFARLALRDGKFGYLNDIPLTFSYILKVCAKYPELSPLADMLTKRIQQPMLDFVRQQNLQQEGQQELRQHDDQKQHDEKASTS